MPYKRDNRRARLKYKYGITPEDYDAMFEAQEGRCAVCGIHQSELDYKNQHMDLEDPRHLDVDHDHTTGKVRGLLCRRCNIGIGYLQDDPERLYRAAEYLEGSE